MMTFNLTYNIKAKRGHRLIDKETNMDTNLNR